jgi:hypothetical protein
LSYLTPQVSTKASNAASASFFVSAIQISPAWLSRTGFGSLFKILAVLWIQQRWPRVFGQTGAGIASWLQILGDVPQVTQV